MFINTLFLATSSSLDALGIGITYGLRRIKLSLISKIIFFAVSFVSTCISVFLGNIIKKICSENFSTFLGGFLIIGMGLYIIYKSFKEEKNYDLDNSHTIDYKESLYLSISLTMDSLCIGIGGGILGFNSFLFPFLVAFLHLAFILFGNFLGENLVNISRIPNNIWTKISGILLIFIGSSKFL